MAILILLFCFFTLFFSLGVFTNSTISKKDLVLKTVLIFCGLLVLITEVLSLFRILNFQTIFLSWIIIFALNILYIHLRNERVKIFYTDLKREVNETYQKIKARKLYERCLLFSVLIILLLLFVQGIIYPPNNADSMTYHLARITSWVSHQSVGHYPTGVIRQIYQPPFAEYVIMHFNILNRSDYFSNLVQFLFLIFSSVGLAAIVETLGLGFSYKVLAVFLGLTIPEVILQATSTQNDIVVSFFIIVAFYCAVKSIKVFTISNSLLFGLSVGLGILTKGTAYIFMPAILLIYGITMLIRLFTTKKYSYFLFAVLAGFMFILVNFGFYYRNYKLTSNLLGVDQKEYNTYSNEKMDFKLFFSSLIKNGGNHVGLFHLKPLSVIMSNSIIRLHEIAGININDPANNFFYKEKYSILYFPAHQDHAPNLIHLLLIGLSLVLIIASIINNRISINVKLLIFNIIFQTIFFCLYLKWQPYHTRLHTPIFLLSIPLICYAISITNNKFKKIFYYSTPFIFGYALMIIFANMNSPYNSTISNEGRYQKYFMDKFFLYDEYNIINKKIQAAGYQNIGLIMGDDDWEYSLFTNCYSKTINPIYINVKNYTKNSATSIGSVNCIVTNSSYNNYFITYQGKRFYNQNPKNQYIHLYQ